MINQTFDQLPDTFWIAAVQVATVWTNPDSAREIDIHGTSNPTNMDKWVEELSYKTLVALCDESRVQSQLLYGEAVLVTEITDGWAHVVIPSQPSHKDERGYPGWVPLNQLKKVEKKVWQREKIAAVTDQFVWLETKNGDPFFKISYMTFLPVESECADRIEVLTPDGVLFLPKGTAAIFQASEGLPKRNGEAIVKAGERFLDLDYFWGGMSAFGYDCSGFCYAMHKANGYQIPRDAGDQAEKGKFVSSKNLLPGDLLFFAYEEGKGKLHHVGIYYGDGKMLHSPKTGKSIEIIDLSGTIYEKELCAARRFWQEAEG